MSERLTSEDVADAAEALSCEVACVRAVIEVESNGKGFGPDGRPIILYEPHVFHRETGGKFSAGHGGVSYAKWGMKPYPKSQADRWAQLEYARKLDDTAALKSASYGLFQIMGFNYRACGFATVQDFVTAMMVSERAQLMAFVAYLKHTGLDRPLRDRRWAVFASRYNGPGYARNHYDTKLAAAYSRWAA